MTRTTRREEREKGVRKVHLKDLLEIGQKVLVLFFSKILNTTHRLNHVHWIEDQILGLGVVSK